MNQHPELGSAEQEIFKSMSALLNRAGLEYRGGILDIDGRRVHYLDYGEGEPVLLVHGGGAGSAIWFRQIEVLAKTRRVIAPDHPVFGLSGQAAYRAPLEESLVRYLTEFMGVLELGRVDAVGLSMGAQAILATALADPDRFNRIVVLDSAGLGREFPLVYKLAVTPLIGRLVIRSNRWGRDSYFKTYEVVNDKFDDAARYKQYAYDVTLPDGHIAAVRSSLKLITGWGGQRSFFTDDQLRSLTNPILAIWGAHDKIFPLAHGYRLADFAPNASLHVIEDAAHVPLLDNPERVNELISGFFA
ncbi:MAG: alpha/beta fold hydrolase [Chloroflexi bacterium]|nr:alpha/beta fold hydrolase [Chloroflexota bacterium]